MRKWIGVVIFLGIICSWALGTSVFAQQKLGSELGSIRFIVIFTLQSLGPIQEIWGGCRIKALLKGRRSS